MLVVSQTQILIQSRSLARLKCIKTAIILASPTCICWFIWILSIEVYMMFISAHNCYIHLANIPEIICFTNTPCARVLPMLAYLPSYLFTCGACYFISQARLTLSCRYYDITYIVESFVLVCFLLNAVQHLKYGNK